VSADEDYTTTITVRAREYVIVDVTAEDRGEARFTVAEQANGAWLPKSDATIGMRDKGFNLPSELPADGVLRIANQGDLPHQVTAFRLPASTSYAEARRLLIHGDRSNASEPRPCSAVWSPPTPSTASRPGCAAAVTSSRRSTHRSPRTADRTSSAASLRPPGSTEPTTAAAVLGLRRQ